MAREQQQQQPLRLPTGAVGHRPSTTDPRRWDRKGAGNKRFRGVARTWATLLAASFASWALWEAAEAAARAASSARPTAPLAVSLASLPCSRAGGGGGIVAWDRAGQESHEAGRDGGGPMGGRHPSPRMASPLDSSLVEHKARDPTGPMDEVRGQGPG